MALTYPLEFPDQPFAAQRCRFSYETFGAMSRTQGGTITFQEFIGGSLWEAFYQTKPLNERNYGRWHAFVLGLRGNRSFKAYDPRRCQPIAYTAATLPSFTPNVTAAGGNSISVSGFPAGFIITAGDYISFPWRNAQALVKFLEGATIGGGGTGIFEVGPTLLAGGTVPVAATVVRPWCYMKYKPGSLQPERSLLDPISFEAIQTMG
jgi:hypothetical protein